MSSKTLKCKCTIEYKKRGISCESHSLEIELFVVPRMAVLRTNSLTQVFTTAGNLSIVFSLLGTICNASHAAEFLISPGNII